MMHHYWSTFCLLTLLYFTCVYFPISEFCLTMNTSLWHVMVREVKEGISWQNALCIVQDGMIKCIMLRRRRKISRRNNKIPYDLLKMGQQTVIYFVKDRRASQMRRHLLKLCSSAGRCTIPTAVWKLSASPTFPLQSANSLFHKQMHPFKVQ